MKNYKCNETVQAAKIVRIESIKESSSIALVLEGDPVPFVARYEWYMKYLPKVGGYFVKDVRGQTSYSSAGVFESNHTEIVPAIVTGKRTMSVLIGNSDDKLTQLQWSVFVMAVNRLIEGAAAKVHFSGGSAWDTCHQNCCFVIEIEEQYVAGFLERLKEIRENFHQDAAAIVLGETVFI